MSNQLYRPNLSIASPSEIEKTAKQLRAIREDFLTTGTLALHVPRSMILKSWQRCSAMQVNPSRRIAPLAVAHETQLSHLREKHELLRRASHAVLEYLTDFFADSGYVIVLSDANGNLLDVIGDTTICRRLARIDFIPGGDWSEGAAGTNAIGTALADGHVVQLLAAEHYCDGWQDLTCTASPIRHPFTGEIIGVLNVTGDYRLIRPFLTSSLATAALEIQQELRLLLTSTPTHTYPRNVQPIVAPTSTPTLPFLEMAMQNNKHVQEPDANIADVPEDNALVGDVQSHLGIQQRRVHDAERLVMAAGTISASLDLDITLNKVAEQAAYLLYLESAAVFLFDDTGSIKSLHTWLGHGSIYSASTGNLLKELLEKAEATLLVQERGEPVFIEDILTSNIVPLALVNLIGVRSLAMLPLVSARGVIGFIAAPKSMPYQWSVDDVRLSQALAAQSASAIENAKMYHTLQQHSEVDQLKRNFVASVSHDLRSPLTAIRASVESLLGYEGFWPVREHEHVLHNIAGQASRLGRLVDQLLDLSRIEAGALPLDREWAELSVLIADTVTRFETLNQGRKVEQRISPDLPLYYVDPDRIVQVLWNLLENAHKYSSPYAPIDVEAYAVGDEVVMCVADHGSGIPPSEREKIFQHFYRLERDQRTHTQGSGLGLAICRGIVEAHGGRIWVEDRPGGGSSFYVALPLVAEPVDLEVFEIADLSSTSIKEMQ
ncbi:MAG TPA: hypothetical protein DHW02_08860 [Ktedonobacter sp.]|nr:hypothetical protein [Ktedonobacter sp.]